MTTKTNNVPKLTKAQNDTLDGLTKVSDKIRYLNTLDWTRGQIATKLGKRYQHVRNVLVEDERQGKTYTF